MCGAVRLVGTGRPKWVAWSHCQSCRRHSGAPVSVFAAFARAAHVVTKGEITKLGSLPGVQRGILRQMRVELDLRKRAAETETDFPVGAFDLAARLRPRRHIFPEERLPGCTWATSEVGRPRVLQGPA